MQLDELDVKDEVIFDINTLLHLFIIDVLGSISRSQYFRLGFTLSLRSLVCVT